MLEDLSPKYSRSCQVDSINHHTTLQAPTPADRTAQAAISPLTLWVENPRDCESKYHNKHPSSPKLLLLGILQQQQENQLITQSIKHPLIHSDKLTAGARVGSRGSSSVEVSMAGEDDIYLEETQCPPPKYEPCIEPQADGEGTIQ